MHLRTAFHLALAETRRARGTLLFCVLSVAIGAFAVSSIRSVTGAFAASLAGQARQILGADLVLEGNRPLDGEVARALDHELAGAGARAADSTRFYSMLARAGDPAAGTSAAKATTLVRVRALSDGFPFYGTIATLPPGQLEHLGDAPSVLVDPAVMRELGLVPGSSVRLGELAATVLGEFVKQPGSPAAEFSLAPYLYVHQRHLAATGLLKTGSRVTYERLFALPDGLSPDALKDEYWDRAVSENLELKTYRESAANVQRFLARVSRFLTLVGLITLFLGALGVGSAFHAFIRQKLDHAAILRCVGARPRDVLLVYGLLATLIASVGSAVGAGLGALAPSLLERVIDRMGQGYLPAELELGASLPALLHGFIAGLWSALVFTLLPLSAVALVAPLRALGRDVTAPRKPAMVRWIGAGGVAGALLLVLVITVGETGSFSVGAWFLAAVVLCLLLLSGLASAGIWLARRVGPRLRAYHLRQGIANLQRPANQTRAVVIAVGSGFFLLSTILILRGSLERTLAIETRGDLPTLFAIDIQADQHDGVQALLARHAAEDVELSPMIAARIRALNGRPLERSDVERNAGRRTWEDRMRTREYFLSYREGLVPSESVTAGRFWTGRPAQQEASLDAELAAGLGIALGDTLTLDIQGLPLDARVTSFREIRWQAMRPNAMILLSPGEIEQAPRMYVAASRVEDRAARYELQQALVASYPNISVVDVSDTAATVLSIVSRIGSVFAVVGLLATVTGAIILAGAISAGRYARQRETTLLRVLGASRADLRRILVAEYMGLALLGTLGGWLLAEVINRVLLPRWFDTSAHVPYALVVPLAVATVLLNTLVGMLVGRRVSSHAPLALLRES
jgi:putative ABC transport system permease protein